MENAKPKTLEGNVPAQEGSIPEGFVMCGYDQKLISATEAFRSPYHSPYCSESCYIMFIED